jgi:hypothetical protein
MTIDRAIDRADRASRNASVMRASVSKKGSRPSANGSGLAIGRRYQLRGPSRFII